MTGKVKVELRADQLEVGDIVLSSRHGGERVRVTAHGKHSFVSPDPFWLGMERVTKQNQRDRRYYAGWSGWYGHADDLFVLLRRDEPEHVMQHESGPTWCIHCGTFDVYAAGKCPGFYSYHFDIFRKGVWHRMFGEVFGQEPQTSES